MFSISFRSWIGRRWWPFEATQVPPSERTRWATRRGDRGGNRRRSGAVRHFIRRYGVCEPLEDRRLLAVLFEADFSNVGDGFASHTTESPPADAPASADGGSAMDPEGRWTASYAVQPPSTDGTPNEFHVSEEGLLRIQDWGSQGSESSRFESVPFDVSGSSSVDIVASGHTIGSDVQNGSNEFFEFFYTLDGGGDVPTEVVLVDDSSGTPVDYVLNGVDVSAATSMTVGFNFQVDGAGDGYEIALFRVRDVIETTPGVTIRETMGTTEVVEGGASDTYDIVLDSLPSSDVTITVTPDTDLDLGAGPNAEVELTFTPANALAPQTVTVTAVDDLLDEGMHTGTISQSIRSSDPSYSAINLPDIVVSVVDNDAPVSTSARINEFLVDQRGPDNDTFVEILDRPNSSLAGLTLLEIEGDSSSNRGVVDKVRDLTSTDANGFEVVSLDGENGTVTYLLVSGFTGAKGLDLDTDDDGSLDMTPWSAVVDGIAVVADSSHFAYSDVALIPGLDGNASAFNGASRVPNGVDTNTTFDWIRNDDRAGLASFPDATAAPGLAINTPGADNQVAKGDPSVIIVESSGSTEVTEGGGTDSYTVALATVPTETVPITVWPMHSQLDLGNGPGEAISLRFTPQDALVPQVVTVSAVDDDLIEGSHTDSIGHLVTGSDVDYAGIAVRNVSVLINDNESVPTSMTARINEFVVDHSGTDTEAFVEIVDTANTDLSRLTLLEIEGDSPTNKGTIDKRVTLSTTDADGFEVVDVDGENGTITLLIVSDFVGALGDDLDLDDDGVFDVTPWTSIVDAVASVEDPQADLAYTPVALIPGMDGDARQYGGASRIPDGNDTDTAGDWVRNNYDGAGLPGASFVDVVAAPGEAINTPGAANRVEALTAFTPTEILISGSNWGTTNSVAPYLMGAVSVDGSVIDGSVTGSGESSDGAILSEAEPMIHERPLPWVHLDTFTVRYTGADPAADAMTLSDPSLVLTFVGASDGTATWTVVDAANPLASVVAGVTTQLGPHDDLTVSVGAVLSVTFDIVPGDTNASFLTDVGDIDEWATQLGSATSETAPRFSDVDGSGLTDIGDLTAIVYSNGASTMEHDVASSIRLDRSDRATPLEVVSAARNRGRSNLDTRRRRSRAVWHDADAVNPRPEPPLSDSRSPLVRRLPGVMEGAAR